MPVGGALCPLPQPRPRITARWAPEPKGGTQVPWTYAEFWTPQDGRVMRLLLQIARSRILLPPDSISVCPPANSALTRVLSLLGRSAAKGVSSVTARTAVGSATRKLTFPQTQTTTNLREHVA